MIYEILRPLLFRLPPECAHHLALNAIKFLYKPVVSNYKIKHFPRNPVKVWGIDFPNPVGLAAGLEKTGQHVDALWGLGFGFIEVGGVTPFAQPGNPKPRLYRLPDARALINRMGFNNAGVESLLHALQGRNLPGIVGINIAKMRGTPLDKALEDYAYCYEALYASADYVTINISSPNTPGLRDLQSESYLGGLLGGLKSLQSRLADEHGRFVPLVVKLSPDLSQSELEIMVKTILKHNIDGIISTNTSINREGVNGLRYADEKGGLSGEPLFERSLDTLVRVKHLVQDQIPIIALGGINSVERAQAMCDAGADLLQLYTGLIYEGPRLIRDIVSNLLLNDSFSIS